MIKKVTHQLVEYFKNNENTLIQPIIDIIASKILPYIYITIFLFFIVLILNISILIILIKNKNI